MAKDTNSRIVSTSVQKAERLLATGREAVVVKDNGTVGKYYTPHQKTDEEMIAEAIKDADRKDGIRK